MKKKAAVAIIAGIALVGVAAYLAAPQGTIFDPDARRHGSVSTATGSAVLGDPAAPITLIEFGDYQCHQCKNWFDKTKPAIKENYIEPGRVKMIFVDLAFLGTDSKTAAQASYCAEDQEMYWEYHDTLYVSQEGIDDGWAGRDRLEAIAFSLGLDLDEFNSCLDTNKYAGRVAANLSVAASNGANSTPTFVVVGPDGTERRIVGAQPYSVFENVFDSLIQS